MDSRLVVLLFLTAVANTGFGIDNICCLPSRYSMIAGFQVGSNEGGHGTATQGRNTVYLDRSMRIIAYDITSWTNGKQNDPIWVLQDFNQTVQYVLNLKTYVCQKSKLEAEWTPPCIPGDALPLRSSYLGDRNDHFYTTNWMFNAKGITVIISTTPPKDGVCIPVNEAFTTENALYGMSFTNFTTEVDAEVFKVPAECEQTNWVPPMVSMFRGVHTTL